MSTRETAPKKAALLTALATLGGAQHVNEIAQEAGLEVDVARQNLLNYSHTGYIHKTAPATYRMTEKGYQELDDMGLISDGRLSTQEFAPNLSSSVSSEPKASNGSLHMGDLFELVGHMNDGSLVVRSADNGQIFKITSL